jgi:PAS domain S-box-containing protein
MESKDIYNTRKRSVNESLSNGSADSEKHYRQILQSLPVAVYTCDADGYILLYNQAAIDLWGREPVAGKELWCGSWQIFRPDGSPLPLDECPMAIALKERRIVNQEILIERPDGTRRYVIPYPQPLFDSNGEMEGAVNMLMDITERKSDENHKAILAAIVQSSEDAIVSKTLTGIITSWNPGAEKLFGFSSREMIGQPMTKIIPKDRLNEETEILAKLRAGERVDHFETRRLTKTGKLIDISLTISPVRDNNNNIIGASKIARDITGQKLLLKAVKESEERFRAIANGVPVMIWIAGEGSSCNFCNKSWLDFTGATMEQEQGNGWLDHIHEEDLPGYLDCYNDSFSKKEEFYTEFRLRRFDGEYRWMSNKGVPQFSITGEIEGYIGACMDITATKDQAERKDDFIRMASHELKTPVTTIKGYVQLLLKTVEGKNDILLTNSLSTIDKQVSKLTTLINDMLDLTKIESGTFQLVKEVFSVNDLAKEIIDEMQGSAIKHTINFCAADNFIVYADRHRITQVFTNYISNAIKYSPNANKINIKISADSKEVLVAVEDFGIGITKSEQGRIFERFYRAQEGNAQTFPGFGIGLYVVHEIIRNHDGKAYVKSEYKKGSVFYFTLPLHLSENN